jgi:hypothetical protein
MMVQVPLEVSTVSGLARLPISIPMLIITTTFALCLDRPTKQCVTSLKTASVLKILDPRTWGRALSEMQGSS